MTIRAGILLRLEAKPGKEEEVAAMLRDALPLARNESGTLHGYAFRLGPLAFGVFDVFPNAHAREAHHHGPIAQAVQDAAARGLLSAPVRLEFHDSWRSKDRPHGGRS
jgi:quinol monooxygenase YgiN